MAVIDDASPYIPSFPFRIECCVDRLTRQPKADIRHPMINSWSRIKHRLRKLTTGRRAAKII
jgi:hypothetical protein